VTGPGADGLITWSLGEMAAGTTRQVTFQVVIDDVDGEPGETVAVDILNAGAVQSDRVPRTLSNEVVTPVTKVLPVKVSQPPKALPKTGSSVQPGPLVATAVTLLGLGLLLMAASRRRRGSHRRS
jgi:LPXTG-motif cell wall-anchored protein